MKPQVFDRKIVIALAIAVTTMATELVAGVHFKSFALVSDGYHFATHVGVLAMTAAVSVATRHPAVRARFSFSDVKVHAGCALLVAVATGLSAVFSGTEALGQLLRGTSAPTQEAIVVGLLGFVSNLATAYLLKPCDHHEHEGSDSHDEDAEHTSRLAAFGHSLLDAAASAVAVVAIVLASRFHWLWADSAVGVVGSIVALAWVVRVSKGSLATLSVMTTPAARTARR